MRKLLFILTVILAPVILLAQPMDAVTIYSENFDGATNSMSTNTSIAGPQGNWRLAGPGISYDDQWSFLPLYVSSPKSFHSPVYDDANYSNATTAVIPLSSSGVDVNYVYLDFDHICKMSEFDNAFIYYQVADGIDESGNYEWTSDWVLLNFTNNSSFYYGDARGVSSSSILGGKFCDKAYSNWLSNNAAAVPNNTWWHHEMFDLTSQILTANSNAIAFQLQFRTKKVSPPGSGTENYAGWYIDNLVVRLSNCELIKPVITMQSPFYYNSDASFINRVGPFDIKAQLYDNDTIAVDKVRFTYEINTGETVTVPNTNAFISNVLNANGHTIQAKWQLPTVCYQDTIHYHIYMEDTHGSSTRFDTFLVAHHNIPTIHDNDIRLDSVNKSEYPHCLITGVPQDVTIYFTNRSDANHSTPITGTAAMTSGTFRIQVKDEAGLVYHDTTYTWNDDICFDVPSFLSLGSFTPHSGFNYMTVSVVSRNGHPDGFHNNDTVKHTFYSCDSLLIGHYTVGGTNPDFQDIDAVKQSLNYCGLGGPVVFHLRPGTYTDCLFDSAFIGQSAVNTITFQGDDRDNVIITNNYTDAGTNTYGAVTLVNVKDYRFKNLTIQGNSNATASRGVLVRGNGSKNIIFDGCKITAYNAHSNVAAVSAISRVTAATGYGDSIVIRNCKIVGGNFGINYVGSNTRKNYVTIDSCDIASCYRGIYTNYTNGHIRHNHIKQVPNSTPQNFSGIYSNYVVGADIDGNQVDSLTRMEYAIYLGNASTEDFFIRNNRVHVSNGNVGIYVTNSNSTNTATGYLYNNEVILYPVTAANSYAVQINSSNNLKVINNSLLAKSDAPYNNTAALYINNTGNNNNIYIYNNLLLNQVVCSDRTDYPLYLNGSSNATGTYNDFYSTSGVVAYKAVARNTIAELENAVNALTNNISLLPSFSDNTQSLLPTSFTGLECWRNESVLTDIRNQNRSGVTYMGAYANQIPSVDAALTALVSPALGECPQIAYDIEVEITNKGSETLNFATTPAVVRIQSTALNLNQEISVNTGSVTALNKVNRVLVQNVPIPANQTVDFKIFITINGDNNHQNDTLVQNFTVETIVPEYSEDFSNGTAQTWTFEQIAGAGNWTVQSGTGVQPAITPVYGTGRLFFNAKNFANNTVSRAILPVVTLTGSVNPILEIWYAHDNTSNKPKEGIKVKVSTDGGNTYTCMVPEGYNTNDTVILRYKSGVSTPEWYLYTFDLSSYQNAGCVYIAFDATAQGGNNINIDRIRVRNLYNNDIAVSKIYGVGETPADYSMQGVVSALVKNEGRQQQNNIPVYLTVTGATEQWLDTLFIPTLPYHGSTLITFPDHHYNVQEVKNVEVRAANDDNNINNTQHWRMVTTHDVATYADTTTDINLIGDYDAVIRPCVRYKTNEPLAVKAVKYYYDQTYIADPANGFRAFVSDASGRVLSTSALVDFSTLQQGQWNIIPIENFALTNTVDEFYVGLEMLAHGNYLCAQVETPLRDSTFYYLTNGEYVPQLSGRFMIGAVVDTPYVHDVALLELVHPVTKCDLGHENLSVRITNNGTTNIAPPIQLHYTINGGEMVSENITDTLHSHETTLFTFNTIYDFTNNQIDVDDNYAIRVWATKLTQDRLTYNDTLGVTVVSRGKSNVPTVQDTVIVNYHYPAELSAQLPTSIPQGVIGWYTNSGYENWNLLGYGDTYTTPIIYFDTTYYATASPGTVQTLTVGTGTANGTDPMTFTNGYSRGRTLYLVDEIGTHGTISSFALNVKTAAGANASAGIPMRIYMKCTEENQFNSTNVDWDAELFGATLVYEGRAFVNHTGWFDFDMLTPFDFNSGNLVVYMETNCADSCTGTGSQCNNCGAYVSGANNSFPSFYMTSTSATHCQKKAANAKTQMTGAYTNVSRKLNIRLTVANLECGSMKVPIRLHVPDIPDYDVETQELTYPSTSCHLYNEHIKVQVKNMLNTPIPANKVVVHALFTNAGTTTEVTHTVAEPFSAEEVKEVEFTNTYDFSAPTADRQFTYTIFTTMNNEEIVYTGNDTITGSLTSTRTAAMPDSIVYEGAYTQPYTILEIGDRPSNVNQYIYYADPEAETLVYTTATSNNPQTLFYTTNPLYDTIVYWVVANTKGNNCLTKPVKVIINVFHPQYDLSTDELIYPVSYQCPTSLNPHLQVSVTNQDTTSTSVVPSGTFQFNARFTGSHNVSGTDVITTPVSSLIQDTITFANGIALGSTEHNRIYQYEIYTTPVQTSMPVYTLNDTIKGYMYFPALPTAPDSLSFTVPYGGTQTVTPTSTALNHFYFYENSENDQAIAEGNSFTTEPIFAPTTYYYSGRIESDGFNDELIAGDGTTNNQNTPFNLGNGHSYSKILYNKEDMNGAEGRIDSIFFQIHTADNNGVGIPMKFWLKNTADLPSIAPTSSVQVNWPAETADAVLVYEGDIALDHTGWIGFAVNGGFDYEGEGLFLYAEHNCGDVPCKDSYGINPVPKFQSTSMGSNQKALIKSSNTEVTSQTSFSRASHRVNTKFKMNYTCESPRAPITISTTVPQHDVGVVAISAPVTQNNNFTDNETVTVTVQNFGTEAASSFPVSYQLANNTPTTQNYSGSLAAGATATMTFNTNCDLTSVYMPTPFRAFTGMTSDTYHANDTTLIWLSSEDPCPSRPISNNQGAHITNVSFAALDNGQGAPYTNHPAEGNGMYSDYTQTVAPVEVILGQEYTMSITHAFTGTSTKAVYKHAWIDYNRNGEFENDEMVFSTPSIPSGDTNATTAKYVEIPVDAQIGMTRMRVICSSNNQTDPCQFYNAEGETEDYSVLLSTPMQIDLGVPAILHPVGDICADDQAKIRVIVRNYGTETQVLSTSNPATITATVTGAVPATYTKVVESATLLPNGEITVVIPDVDFSAAGTYTVHVALDYASDQYMTNNTRISNAVVATTVVTQLPFLEIFDSQGTDPHNPQLSDMWEVTGDHLNNYQWKETVGHSPNSGLSTPGGPLHDHTYANTMQEDAGGYVCVAGVNGQSHKTWNTALTSHCINMHYNGIYPAELYFYKYFTGANNANFNMSVEIGSGEYYQTIGQLTKADGGQVGNNDLWSEHLIVMHTVDEVARLRFNVTNQVNRIDPCIDDINLIIGQPDMAMSRVVYPEGATVTDVCLPINSVVSPVVELYNNGNSAVEEFDILFSVGTGNDVDTVREHVVHHLNPRDTMQYTSTHEFVVTNLTSRWEVKATVIIPEDKNNYNNTKRTLSCTDVGIDDYENTGNVYLGQNEPNPAVTTARIPYSVPEAGKVTFEIVTTAGQVIYTTTEEAEQGVNYLEVNTSNLAVGVYYYTMRYKDTVLTKKMVVEK